MAIKHTLKQYQVNLHLLCAVHIGTGQELDPFSYIIRNDVLYLIDFVKWLENYSEADKLNAILDSENFVAIRSYIAEHFDDESAILCSIPVDDPILLETYKRAVRGKDPRNQVLINPIIRNELTKEPYIPGSSVKGAIRTAISNQFVKSEKITKDDVRDYNKKIFGRATEDPMKNLKISDVALNNPGSVIIEAEEYPLKADKNLTPKGHTEVTMSLCHTGKPVVYPLRFSLSPFPLHNKTIDLTFIINALNQFYLDKYVEENEKFFTLPHGKEIRQEIMLVNQSVSQLKTNEALIRIGHFSHVECVTLDYVRNPKTRRGKDGKPLPWGKTRTLANGLYPFGWAKLEFLDMDSTPRPERKWPFLIEKAVLDSETKGKQKRFESLLQMAAWHSEKHKPAAKKETTVVRKEELSPLEKILKKLDVIKTDDMGQLASIIQLIDTLKTDTEKGTLAKAVKEKMSKKAFKKHKKKEYLMELINKIG